MTSSRPRGVPLWDDVRTGLLYALGFSILAILIIGVAFISNAIGASRISGWDKILPFGLPLVILGYFVAGTLAGTAFWVLRPVRRWLIGWLLTGFVIAALVYGAIGITGIIGFYFGANILDLKSAAEGWQLLPMIAGITGVFPGIPVGMYYWYQARHGR